MDILIKRIMSIEWQFVRRIVLPTYYLSLALYIHDSLYEKVYFLISFYEIYPPYSSDFISYDLRFICIGSSQ